MTEIPQSKPDVSSFYQSLALWIEKVHGRTFSNTVLQSKAAALNEIIHGVKNGDPVQRILNHICESQHLFFALLTLLHYPKIIAGMEKDAKKEWSRRFIRLFPKVSKEDLSEFRNIAIKRASGENPQNVYIANMDKSEMHGITTWVRNYLKDNNDKTMKPTNTMIQLTACLFDIHIDIYRLKDQEYSLYTTYNGDNRLKLRLSLSIKNGIYTLLGRKHGKLVAVKEDKCKNCQKPKRRQVHEKREV
jgi:hypothetical protein